MSSFRIIINKYIRIYFIKIYFFPPLAGWPVAGERSAARLLLCCFSPFSLVVVRGLLAFEAALLNQTLGLKITEQLARSWSE
jgi:hypothetical protein